MTEGNGIWDNNGFFDKISYDLDGGKSFETVINLKELGIDDRCELIDISHFKYTDFTKLQEKVSEGIWQQSQLAEKVAKKYGLDLNWYARWQHPHSTRERYHNGYWLQFYIYKDLENLFLRQENKAMLKKLNKAYYGANWEILSDK